MQAIRPFLCCILLMAAAKVSAHAPACPDIDAPPAPACVASHHGLAYADTDKEAESAARAQAEAAARFATHFGEAPAGVLILSTSHDPVDARDFARANGLAYAQVWLPGSAKQAMAARALRRVGMDAARIRRATAGMADQHENMLRHEVGHAMYAAAFWPNTEEVPGQGYGSPAPDWLDEAAAVLMESAESQGARVAQYLEAAKAAPRSIPPFPDFLEMEHPIRTPTLARQLERGQKSDSGVRMMVSSEADAAVAATFYGQSLLMGMFLIETSGDPRILAPISAAIADGIAFTDWLAGNGASYDLPDSLAALQTAWEDWSRRLPGRARDAK